MAWICACMSNWICDLADSGLLRPASIASKQHSHASGFAVNYCHPEGFPTNLLNMEPSGSPLQDKSTPGEETAFASMDAWLAPYASCRNSLNLSLNRTSMCALPRSIHYDHFTSRTSTCWHLCELHELGIMEVSVHLNYYSVPGFFLYSLMT